VHLLALATLGGSVLIIDLRLLGLVLKGESARTIGRDLGRILLGSLVLMIVSGVMLLSEEALKCYYSPAFRWKMTLLFTSVVFGITQRNTPMEQGRYGLYCFALFVCGVFVAGWLMWLIRR